MIRIIWIGALTSVLCLVLWVPSAYSPQQLMDALRAEHDINTTLWGSDAALTILERTLDFNSSTGKFSVPPPESRIDGQPGLDQAMASEFAQMNMRLFGAPYFKSLDSMFALATYRAATLLHFLPLLLVFMVISFTDGLVVRSVRAREFVPPSSEIFIASAASAIALLALVLIAFFVPHSFNPLYRIVALVLMLFLLSRALADYHKLR